MPSDSVLHLSRDEVLAIHERLVAQFGGLPGVRDLGFLEKRPLSPPQRLLSRHRSVPTEKGGIDGGLESI